MPTTAKNTNMMMPYPTGHAMRQMVLICSHTCLGSFALAPMRLTMPSAGLTSMVVWGGWNCGDVCWLYVSGFAGGGGGGLGFAVSQFRTAWTRTNTSKHVNATSRQMML